MAKLRVNQSIENTKRVFLFVHDLTALSQSDKDLLTKFGEPEINLGGTFTTSSVDWTLPNNYVKIVSGMPARVEFDVTVAPFSTSTADRLATYRTTITSRFSTAITDLRANGDTFTNEYVTQV